jgi:hypothetical protein
MTKESRIQQIFAAAATSDFTLEDSLSYGRRKGSIKYEGEGFIVSATSFFWMIDFNKPPSPERRALLESKGFEDQGGLWMLLRNALLSDEVMALARALERTPGV